MAFKKIISGKEAFNKIIKGIDVAADAVSATLGPKGRNVYLYDKDGIESRITNDGVSIANKIYLKDLSQDAGAWIIRNISAAQLDSVGDGTSTVSLLTQQIIHECLARPESPIEIRESLKNAAEKVLSLLKKRVYQIKKGDVEKVALISAEDKVLAKKISDLVNQLGEKAVIMVEDSKTMETYTEVVEGYEAHVGFLSQHFITDKKNSRAVYENVKVFCSQKKISNVVDIQPLFESLAKEKVGSLVIVCEEIDDAMLGIFVTNKIMGRMNLLVIKAQGELLEDIAGTVGAGIVSDKTGISFKDFDISNLGEAKKVVADANKTLFIGEKDVAKKYADDLESKADGEPNQYTQKAMYKRVAKLRGGIGILKVGSATDGERGYLKDKADDAVKATLAALEEGVCEGGGMTFWRISREMPTKTVGEQILSKVLKTPLKKIIENAGVEYAEIVSGFEGGDGYDAKNGRYVDMVLEGIIDPHKVLRCAVENAVSAASSFITIDSLVYDDIEQEETK